MVGRVRHGDGVRASLALERQDDALGGHFCGHEPDDLGIYFEPGEGYRRHAVLAGQNLGDLELLDEPELHQDVPEPVLAALLLG